MEPAINKISQHPRKKKPELFEIKDENCMVYPTITISASNQHLERKWEWIKIGDLTIKIGKSAIVKGG